MVSDMCIRLLENPVAIEIASRNEKKRHQSNSYQNLSYSKSLTSRHPSKKKLYELADIILDNHGDVGDACIKIDGFRNKKVSPTSTVIGTMMLNSIVAAVVHTN